MMETQKMDDKNSGGTGSGTPLEGAPVSTPQQGAEVIPVEHFNKYKSVMDQKLDAKAKELMALQESLSSLNGELAILKEGLPADAVKRLEVEKQARVRDAQLKDKEKVLSQRELKVKARELVQEYQVKLAVDDLVKLGSDVEMELAILKEKQKPAPVPPNLPNTQTLDLGSGVSGSPQTPDARLQLAIQKAMKK